MRHNFDRYITTQPDPEYVVDKWEERDRLHIHLATADGDTIAEWWDEDAQGMFEDGFFNPRDLERSVIDYAVSVGLIRI